MAKKRKAPKAPPMVMKRGDVDKRLRLLQNWGWNCVLCGQVFETVESVTVEHLIPKSRRKDVKGMEQHHVNENKAPSHFNCNQLRQNLSLIEAMQMLSRKRRVMGYQAFTEWANKRVPHRIVPIELMQTRTLPPEKPVMDFEFIKLPDWLPGMS